MADFIEIVLLFCIWILLAAIASNTGERLREILETLKEIKDGTKND